MEMGWDLGECGILKAKEKVLPKEVDDALCQTLRGSDELWDVTMGFANPKVTGDLGESFLSGTEPDWSKLKKEWKNPKGRQQNEGTFEALPVKIHNLKSWCGQGSPVRCPHGLARKRENQPLTWRRTPTRLPLRRFPERKLFWKDKEKCFYAGWHLCCPLVCRKTPITQMKVGGQPGLFW